LKPGNSLYYVQDHKNSKGDQVVANTEYVASGGSVKDAGARLIFEIATAFANYQITTEVLAASVRNPVQLQECLLAGADILTVPANVLSTVADHPLTTEGMKAFVEDSKAFAG
jgi:transaldolase